MHRNTMTGERTDIYRLTSRFVVCLCILLCPVLVSSCSTFRHTYTIYEPVPDSRGVTGPVEVSHFKDLLSDDLPGSLLDESLKLANLSQPISADPRASDPRFAELKKSLTISVENASTIQITLKWDDEKEGRRIVSSLRRLYIEERSMSSACVDYVPVTFLKAQIADYKRREAHEHRSKERKRWHTFRMEMEAELKRDQGLQSKDPP